MDRRFTFGNDFPSRMETDSMMRDDELGRLRDRFHDRVSHDRARSYRIHPDPELDRWFETGHDAFNQPPFKIPREDERSSYVRNIPIFQEDHSNENSPNGSDENLIRQQSKSAIPRPVPPRKSTSPTRTAAPPTLPKPKIPIRVTPSNGSDSGIERAASGSPSDNIDSPGSSGTIPRFGFADRQQRASSVGRGGLWEKEKQIPVKIERDSAKPVVQKEAIPMGYTAQRDPKEPIPMGFERPSSAPAENQSSSPSIDRKLDPPKVPRPPTSSTGLGGPAKDSAGVHRVPIVVKNSDLPRSASAPPKPTEKSPSPPILKPKTPLERIEEISSGVRDLESRINAFEGSRVDHEWRLLDELLTQAVLKLDTVPTDGVDEIRNARKVAVKYVHDLANFLEQKAKADRPKSKSPTAAGKSSSPGATTRIVIPMHPNARMGEKEIDL